MNILVDHAGYKGLGDIVCEQGLYPMLLEAFPKARLWSRGSRTLSWGNPLISGFDEVTPSEQFDRVVAVPDYFRAGIAAAKAEAFETGKTFFDLIADAAGFAGAQPNSRLYVLPREIEELGLADYSGSLIVAVSVDGRECDRRWGQERFADLATYLEERHGALIVEIGAGLNEGHMGLGLDLVGKTTLRQSMAVIWAADVFVGNHGGLTHLAGGVGTPILSPWGASHPYWAYAYDEVSIAIETEPPCRNCLWIGQHLIAQCAATDPVLGRTPCTQSITPKQMMGAADALLGRMALRGPKLREAKLRYAAQAIEPSTLACNHPPADDSRYSTTGIALGGTGNWSMDFLDGKLQLIVAFPDWSDITGWTSLITAYLRSREANSRWALVLATYPLTGQQALNAVLREALAPFAGQAIGKIMLLPGPMDLNQRAVLLGKAHAFVPLPGPWAIDREQLPAGVHWWEDLERG